MAKEKNATVALLFREFFQLGVYKRSQGWIARQVTMGAMLLIAGIGCWRFYEFLKTKTGSLPTALWVPAVLFGLSCWVAFRLINMPNFADFLIAVEAEMNKVSWPSRGELVRSLIVVILSILFLVLVLWLYDVFWIWVLRVLHVTIGKA